jgi:hypothetical protein
MQAKNFKLITQAVGACFLAYRILFLVSNLIVIKKRVKSAILVCSVDNGSVPLATEHCVVNGRLR